MSNEPSTEETFPSFDQERYILSIAAQLGFVEDDTLKQLREKIQPGMDFEELLSVVNDWEQTAMEHVDRIMIDHQSNFLLVGKAIAKVGLFARANIADEVEIELIEAIEFAYQYNLDDIIRQLKEV